MLCSLYLSIPDYTSNAFDRKQLILSKTHTRTHLHDIAKSSQMKALKKLKRFHMHAHSYSQKLTERKAYDGLHFRGFFPIKKKHWRNRQHLLIRRKTRSDTIHSHTMAWIRTRAHFYGRIDLLCASSEQKRYIEYVERQRKENSIRKKFKWKILLKIDSFEFVVVVVSFRRKQCSNSRTYSFDGEKRKSALICVAFFPFLFARRFKRTGNLIRIR